MGSLCGGVELFESVLKRAVKGQFEMTFVGPSQGRESRGDEAKRMLKSLKRTRIKKHELVRRRTQHLSERD